MTKLEVMLKYVSEHNEFYKKRIEEYQITNPLDISQWPVLTRKELQENRYNMFSDGYTSQYYSELLNRHSTSGSSGIPVHIYWDRACYMRSVAPLWRLRKKYYKITPSSKRVMMTRISDAMTNNPLLVIDRNLLRLSHSFVSNEANDRGMLKQINEFAPEWLYIQPSKIEELINLYKENHISPPKSLTYIETMGEILLPSIKEKIENFFNVPVVNMYGSEEHNGIAYEVAPGEMEVIKENVFIETMRKGKIYDNGTGEAIITNLNNKVMPLIRYNQEDIIELRKGSGDISDESITNRQIISSIKGRKNEIVELNGFEINSFLLSSIVYEIQNKYNDPIKRYHYRYFRQERKLCLHIQLSESYIGWKENIYIALKQAFCSLLGENPPFYFEIESNDELTFPCISEKFQLMSIVE